MKYKVAQLIRPSTLKAIKRLVQKKCQDVIELVEMCVRWHGVLIVIKRCKWSMSKGGGQSLEEP